jgi:hypothetical protein
MIDKVPVDKTVEFNVNGYKCGYDGNIVWRFDEDGTQVDIGSFEDITLLEKTSQCAIFYSKCLNEHLAFNGEEFFGITDLILKIIPEHDIDLPQLPMMWEQVRFIVYDDRDIINHVGLFGEKEDFHWGIESSCFMVQKDEYFKGMLLIGICSCTCQGDDDILVDVAASENYISWKVYHDRNHENSDFYLFNKKKYENALKNARVKITRKIEDARDWAWLLSYSKKELYESIQNA